MARPSTSSTQKTTRTPQLADESHATAHSGGLLARTAAGGRRRARRTRRVVVRQKTGARAALHRCRGRRALHTRDRSSVKAAPCHPSRPQRRPPRVLVTTRGHVLAQLTPSSPGLLIFGHRGRQPCTRAHGHATTQRSVGISTRRASRTKHMPYCCTAWLPSTRWLSSYCYVATSAEELVPQGSWRLGARCALARSPRVHQRP